MLAAVDTPRPWRDAWHEALYGEGGFFLREAPAAHFRTSVALAPYAAAVRRLADRVDAALGHPDPFDVVDVGAGRGELLLGLGEVPARWRLTAVERAPDPGGTGMRWEREVPPLEGLLLAGEWLDAVPLDVVADGRVVLVDTAGEESLGPPAEAASLAWARRWWPAGRRVEVGLPREQAWTAAVAQVRRGVAVAVDYGHVRGDVRTWGDRRPTLTGYRDGRQVRPLPDGSCDITAHVALDAVAAAVGGRVLPQRQALLALGLDPTPPPRELARTDPRGYLALLAEASAGASLVAPRGLGSHGWVVREVEVEPVLPT